MLNLMRSNRVEVLADVLAQRVSWPGQLALSPVTIAVASKAWQQWVTRALADRLGVAANLRLPLLREAIDDLLRETSAQELSIAGAEHYTLAVLAEAPLVSQTTAQQPAQVFAAAPEGVMRLSACRELGLLFDSYNQHRPDVVGSWRGPKLDHWQAQLWSAATRRIESSTQGRRALCPASALEQAGAASLHGHGATASLSRLAVFAPAVMTPLQLEALLAASALREIDLYLLESSSEYWGDIRGRRDLGTAPRLVISLGRVERELRDFVESAAAYQEPAGDLFRVSEPESLLCAIQRRTAKAEPFAGKGEFELSRQDHSIEIHSCAGRLREIEVVRELVLEELGQGAAPEDILVLAPDMAAYAPFVDAVFGSSEHRSSIPVNLGGERAQGSSPVVDVAVALLELSASRLSAQQLIDFLWLPAVRERFALSESDVETVRGFIERASIRFALDGAHRAAHGFGELDENTLMFGLWRLLLGYAVPEQEAPLVCGIAPAGQTSGELAPVLGALAQAAQMLGTHLSKLSGSHALVQWRALILSAVEDFSLEHGRSAHERRAIGETLARFVAIAQEAGLEEPIDATMARALVLPKIVNAAARRDHFRGGVEFASLSAAAGVPARAVFVVGMNDGELPRSVQRPSMDLLSKSPRLLDPSPRAEDQRNVLAALLGARRRFVATYSGVSQQDGTMRAPSVLVDEIIEAAVEVVRSSAEDVRRRLVVEHPLSRFAPAYFDGDPCSRVFSTDEGNRACAAVLTSRNEPSKTAFGTLVESEAAPESGIVSLEDLVHGLGRPLLHLWTRVLGAGVPKTAMPTLPGYEPAGRDGLAEYELREALLREAMQQRDPAAVAPVLLARGVLPPGELGRARCEELFASARFLCEVAEGLDLGETVADHLVEVTLPFGTHKECVVGVLSGRRRRGRLEVTSSRNPRRLLHAWVRHLAMCGAGMSSAAGTSALVRRGPGNLVETWTMPALDGALAVDRLAGLVGLYQLAARVPLRLFSGASFAFSKALFEGKPESTAWDLARLEWQPPSQKVFGDEAEKTITRYLFGRIDFELLEEHPTAPELSFAELSAAIFGPIFEHCTVNIEKST